jgi:hypothetical protein
LTKREALDTLGVLAGLHAPVWLAGGLAADFHVGRFDPARFGTVEGLRFRLVSAEDDCVFTKSFGIFVAATDRPSLTSGGHP